ncbi:hypothetical protein CathTA2_1653 [Caldalkalibacillus thermarum TA2.A1]|uniref:DUF418 domain-containing protein n=1 Tax=Caldalkalibacillus thermarum (strain TA2.A1) TaxID=986075 RepID=F5L753_CALTT|nr:DUF418 domain-containing protein [Caldalkalibacillus thermarum]EGL82829.1 hypothetical protein CathTA2_1653 [Caldalkalibacillus thermarum TA2.A1]QZT34867.1 DUF418 domain-containing protein [Caldalkalibacillus thermarum TA2.A1]
MSLHPTSPQERLEVLDQIRGFALLGILLANMAFFASPVVYIQMAGIDGWESLGDKWALWGIQFFAEAKFFTMFSFLFGLGFVLFMERAEAKGYSVLPLFTRRLVVLFMIGMIHAFFIWAGDILMLYAVLGFILLFFRRSSPKTLLAWAVGLWAVPVVVVTLLLAPGFGGEFSDPQWEQSAYHYIERSIAAYGSGTFLEITAQRMFDYLFMAINSIFVAPLVVAMFLTGLYVGKRRLYQQLHQHETLFRRIRLLSLCIGVPAALLQVYSHQQMLHTGLTLYQWLHFVSVCVAGPGLCFFYITSLLQLYRHQGWQRRLAYLAPVGRMALTNYLLQSIVCTLLFYNYGLGLYNQVAPVWWGIIAAVLYPLQVCFSHIWLGHFRYGPAEWLWRSLTYWSWQPLKK